ncbi:PD-(D/E)XK nuclease family protein [Halomarina rubra]|uniref:PD-(D/E)XK nuclease family protein n=1 Tax=Halomarina rubra TaxID=2071873 RepID=A0ABD6AX49_9EURY|nr:PD-(D/E)XK nuclease family protein [Halomarina rubra]
MVIRVDECLSVQSIKNPLRPLLRSFAGEMQPLLEEGSDPPLTTPEVLAQVRTEWVWQSYITYLIDPGQPHGFGGTFTDAFLEACQAAGAFDTDLLHPDRSRVEVESEVGVQGRRADILVYHPERWFLLLELKVDSPEGEDQTADYATAQSIGPLGVSEYPEESRFYGFASPTIPRDIHPAFQGVRWESVGSQFAEARNHLSLTTYPTRSIVQLDDFIATVRTAMTEQDTDTREKARLYFEYREEIDAAEKAVTDLVKDELRHDWTTVFTEKESAPSFWDDSWHFPAIGYNHGQFARTSWQTPNGINVHFKHHPDEENFRAGEIDFRLDIGAPKEVRDGEDGRQPLREEFLRLLDERQVKIPESATVVAEARWEGSRSIGDTD